MLRTPTTHGIDPFGNVFLVEGQLFDLFDGDDSTNGEAPFSTYRLALQELGIF